VLCENSSGFAWAEILSLVPEWWIASRSRAPAWAGKRGYDGGKKIKGRKRHILVDTEGLVLKVKVHSAKVMDWDGIKTLLQRVDEHFPRFSHLWVDAGYRGEDKGKEWVERVFGWSVDLVERPKKPAPKEVLMAWAEQ
jgi:hypothetical protein